MDYKKTNASPTTITRNLAEFDSETGNIYETVSIVNPQIV